MRFICKKNHWYLFDQSSGVMAACSFSSPFPPIMVPLRRTLFSWRWRRGPLLCREPLLSPPWESRKSLGPCMLTSPFSFVCFSCYYLSNFGRFVHVNGCENCIDCNFWRFSEKHLVSFNCLNSQYLNSFSCIKWVILFKVSIRGLFIFLRENRKKND